MLTKQAMDTERQQFEQMLTAMMDFVDKVNESHAGGVDFGVKHPLFPAEIHTVEAIGNHRGISITELARLLRVSKPTISERIKRLIAKGVIRKESNAADAKSVTLWLTSDGKTAYDHHESHHKQMYDSFCAYFGEETGTRIESFHETFTQLSEMMQTYNSLK